MSDTPPVPPKPLMSAERARDIGRAYQAWSEYLAAQGLTAEGRSAAQQAQFWMTYAMAELKGSDEMEKAPWHPTRIERDAILTGLRLLQESLLRNDLRPDLVDILTNGGIHHGINATQIDKLCEMLTRNPIGSTPSGCP